MKIFFFISILVSVIIDKIFAANIFPSSYDNNFTMGSLLSWNETKFISNNKSNKCKGCIPEKIKSLNDSIFLVSFPRNDNKNNFTFAKFNKSNNYFEPWPSMEANNINKCTNNDTTVCLFSVTAFDIDKNGKIYIIDNEGIKENTRSFALKILSKDGKPEKNIKINQTNITDNSTYLNDIVIDVINNYCYIADSNIEINEFGQKKSLNPGILVLNLKNTTDIKKILTKNNSVSADNTYWYHLNDTPVYDNTPIKVGVSGLALSCDSNTLFFSSLSSRTFYSIATSQIIGNNNTDNFTYYYSYKHEASLGLIFSNSKNLYMTGVETGSIYLANQIDYDLQRFDYKDLYKIDKSENNNTLAEYMDIYDGKLYFIRKNFDIFLNKSIEGNNNYSNFYISYIDIKGENSFRFGCPGVEANFGIGNIIIWIIFILVLGLVFVFVCVSRQSNEEKYDLIKSSK